MDAEIAKYAQGMNASPHVLDWLDRQKGELGSQQEVEHIIDFLISEKAPKRLERATYEQMKVKAEQWVESLNKKAGGITELESDVEVALDFKDGFKFVKLVGENAYKREGLKMRHCVASYFGKDDEIYSLRDENNEPHCTISRSSQQIKGKGNGAIHPKYIRYVVEFLEFLEIEVRDSEMKNLGYYNIEPIVKDISTSSINLFNKKYLYKDDVKNLKDKKGAEYYDFRLWSIVPILSVNLKNKVTFNFNISEFISNAIEKLLKKRNKNISTEYSSTAVADGISSTAVANGISSTAVANGHYSTAVANGHSSTAVADGISSTAVANGISSTAVANQYYSTAVANGHSSTAVANGISSTAVANQYSSTAVATEHYSTAVANQYYSTAVANGHYSTAVANGHSSTAEVKSKNSIGLITKWESKVKGVVGSWLVLAEWDENHDNIIFVKSVKVDGKNIKENTWYEIKNGEVVEFTY